MDVFSIFCNLSQIIIAGIFIFAFGFVISEQYCISYHTNTISNTEYKNLPEIEKVKYNIKKCGYCKKELEPNMYYYNDCYHKKKLTNYFKYVCKNSDCRLMNYYDNLVD
jgi:hypothetical protein